MAEDLGDKTEAPTSRRLEEAREKGQVVKSQDLVGAIDLVAALVLLATLGGGIIRAFAQVMRRSLDSGYEQIRIDTVGPLLRAIVLELLVGAGPVIGGLLVISVLAHLVQTGLLWTTEPLIPNLDRLNPINGIKRLFGARGGAKTVVNSLKLVAVLWTAWSYIEGAATKVVSMPSLTAAGTLQETGHMAVDLASRLLVMLLVIGIIDFMYMKWQHNRDLRMTMQEVKDERRSMDGDPQIKGRRLRMMRELAVQRINADVPRAAVVLTNPTHYSVAIEYDTQTMKAPRVIAKGVDFVAMRIRHVAMLHSVPIVERPPLARTLYASVEVGQEISPQYYEAVAEVLAYVYRLEAHAA
jgi:flagellar biosynthetic protein FlhB